MRVEWNGPLQRNHRAARSAPVGAELDGWGPALALPSRARLQEARHKHNGYPMNRSGSRDRLLHTKPALCDSFGALRLFLAGGGLCVS